MRITSSRTERGTGAGWALVVATAIAGLAAAALVALTPWHVPSLSGADRRGIGTAPGVEQMRAPAAAETGAETDTGTDTGTGAAPDPATDPPAVAAPLAESRSERCEDPAAPAATPMTGRRTLEG